MALKTLAPAALIATLIATTGFVAPVAAQTAELPSRPGFLQAMGLLKQQNIDISRDGNEFANLTLFQGEGIVPIPRDLGGLGDEIIAAWDFVTPEGQFIESLTLTTASVDLAEAETRRFALANLLVLRSFPQLARQFPGARLLAFGPLVSQNELDMVQMVGSFTAPDDDRSIVFRHIGVMRPDSTQILVAIINIDTAMLPIRSDDDLMDTFAGRSLGSLTLADPVAADAAEEPEDTDAPLEDSTAN